MPQSSPRACPQCSTAIPEGALYCQICGQDVSGAASSHGHARVRERLARLLGDRYEIGDLLGAGGMGVVFLARDVERDRPVAIKVLSPELAGDANVVTRFAREAATASSLDHPGIVRIHDAASEQGLHYFIMQYVAGKTLADLLRHEPRAPVAFVARVLREASAALAHAHEKGVVHRDVKPENIMLDEKGRVLLTDFGISKVSRVASGATTVQRLTETGGIVGTPHYMAPEHALGQAVDGRADQYALAVVGFQMLAGRVPFDDETSPAIIQQHINSAAPRLTELRPDVPPHLAAAIARAMSKAPAHRFATIEEFAAAAAGPVPVRGATGRMASWAAALLLVAGSLAAGALWLRRDSGGAPVAQQAATARPVPTRAGGSRPVAATPAKRQSARLSITSTPSATVFVNGKRIGVTPIVNHPLPVSTAHHIRLEKKGYRTARDTVRVTGTTRALRRRYVLRRETR